MLERSAFFASEFGWVIVAAVGLGVALLVWRGARAALDLRAYALVPAFSRWLSRRVGPWSHDADSLLSADGAPADWIVRRRAGLRRLTAELDAQQVDPDGHTALLRTGFSDLRFTDASRVPFPFANEARRLFNLSCIVTTSRGPWLTHPGGRTSLDVSGSYGLNVAGYDAYKAWLDQGWARVRDLGPVLGPVHPLVAENVQRLKAISGLDEVSFHMSGTEAVMAAVRLARFNTRRRFIVCFSGAYHGWWDGVQAGLGSERDIADCLVLKDFDARSLNVIRRRAHEIAAVLVNPVQSFHPNSPPPNDAVLLTTDMRKAGGTTEHYGAWLQQIRDACASSGVPFVLDEVYTGFRLAKGGAQEYFGVDADMVVYGKTVAGGLPIGAVCGRSWLMRRTDPDHPMRMAYVVGTFSAHPLVMATMHEFLNWATARESAARYDALNRRCAEWTFATNEALAAEGLPVRIGSFASIWTVLFTERSRYGWLLQYYLRAAGLTLSWVGTGRCLVSMDVSDDDYDLLKDRLVSAVRTMAADGWWVTTTDVPGRDRLMTRQVKREVLGSLVPPPLRRFYAAVMKRKHDDHHASHNDPANQLLHIVSSSAFIFCYAVIFTNLTLAMFVGLASLLVRQFGHAVLEPACHEEEAALLGFNTPSKTLIVVTYLLIPIVLLWQAGAWSWSGFWSLADPIALQWWRFTLMVVFGRVLYLAWKHDVGAAMVWFVKLVTDPFTDLATYVPRMRRHA